MVYANIINGEIVEVGSCPANTRKTSNFRLLDDEEKKKEGWYLVSPDLTILNAWQRIESRDYTLTNKGELSYTVYHPQPDLIVPAEYDAEGNEISPETRTPQDDIEEIIQYTDYEVQEVKNIVNNDLEEYKKTKNEEIKQTYLDIGQEGFICSNGIKLDCRESDKINWLGTMLKNAETYSIKDYNNVTHENISNEEFMTMYNELSGYYEKILADKWALNTLVNEALTHEEVSGIFWRVPVYDEEDNFVEWSYNPIFGG